MEKSVFKMLKYIQTKKRDCKVIDQHTSTNKMKQNELKNI